MSQVEKFNAKYTRDKNDERAVMEDKLSRSQTTSSTVYEESTEELKKEGSIKEAAAVFTHEGLGTFATMFSNSVESMLNKTLQSKLDAMADKIANDMESKILEILDGVTEGMKRYTETQAGEPFPISDEQLLKTIEVLETKPEVIPFKLKESTLDKIDLLSEVPPEVISKVKQVSKEEEELLESYRRIREESEKKAKEKAKEKKEKKPKPEPKKRQYKPRDESNKPVARELTSISWETEEKLERLPQYRRLGSTREDIAIAEKYIIPLFKTNPGVDIASKQIVEYLNDYNIGIPNSTNVMQRIVSNNPFVEKSGFGLYKYEEKTFGENN